ncbi:hypothetical protein D3C75_1210350 [compost metagenome]
MHKLDIQWRSKQGYTIQIVIGHNHQFEACLFHTCKPFNQFWRCIRGFSSNKRIVQISYYSTIALSVQLFQINVKNCVYSQLGH